MIIVSIIKALLLYYLICVNLSLAWEHLYMEHTRKSFDKFPWNKRILLVLLFSPVVPFGLLGF